VNTKKEHKLQHLWLLLVPKTVCVASWLAEQGFSYDLQKRYRKSGWLEPVGTGAFKKPSDEVRWEGGVYAVQSQLQLPIHAGGLTALTLQGYAHYIRSGVEAVQLFAPLQTRLPAWFKSYAWGVPIQYSQTSFLPNDVGIIDHTIGEFNIQISSPERAILECLYLSPQKMDIIECYDLMEGLNTLRPQQVQLLLEACHSIKAKRLFLYMAHKAGHAWGSRVKKNSLDLGKGVRTITKGGVYNDAFNLILPKELISR
jgi:Transcriptional regulator, AbiEi antitoxin, Type IV TA system/Transcriptional regulator, AbiEi antitoxin N-terminal domain